MIAFVFSTIASSVRISINLSQVNPSISKKIVRHINDFTTSGILHAR